MQKAKRALSYLLCLAMLFTLFPAAVLRAEDISAADYLPPGTFREDFSGIADISESAGLQIVGGTMTIVDDAGAGNGRALSMPEGAVFHTREATPENFIFEYRFKNTAQAGGVVRNWLASPADGLGTVTANPLFMYDPNGWRAEKSHLLSGWDAYDNNPLLTGGTFGGAWTKITITFYNGVYTLYINEEKMGERNFGTRTNGKYIRFQLYWEMEILLDYIEVREFDGSDPFPPIVIPVEGTFREDFSGITDISDSLGLQREGSGGTMAVVDDPVAGNVLQVTGGDSFGGAILRTSETTPENFKVEYRFKVTYDDGAFNNWLASPPISGEGNATNNPILAYTPRNWRTENFHLIPGWDRYGGNELLEFINIVDSWTKVTITFYNGVYTLYVNEQKIGERDFGARTNGGHLRFQVRERFDMLFDYIEVTEFDGTSPFPPIISVPGAFNLDFGSFDVGETFSRLENPNIGGLTAYDEFSGATATVVDGQDTANGRALHVSAMADVGSNGTDEWNFKGFTFVTTKEVPENFQLEYRIKINDARGDRRAFITWLNATNIHGDWTPSGPEFTYLYGTNAASQTYFLRSHNNTSANELRGPNGAVRLNEWTTVRITYWNGIYTLYVNGEEIGERNFGLRTEGHIRMWAATIDMYIDYIKVDAYERTGIQDPSINISFGRPGHIFDTSEATAFDLSYDSHTNSDLTVSVSYTVRNQRDVIVQQGTENILASSGRLERRITLDEITGTGLFNVTVYVTGGGNVVSQSADFSRVFSVIDNRAGEPFGIGTHFISANDLRFRTSMDILAMSGVSMIRSDFAWQEAQRGVHAPIEIPQRWIEFINEAHKRGLEVLPIFSYGNTHFYNYDPVRYEGMRLRGIPVTPYGREAYARFCRALVEAFYPLGVRYFNVWNEPNNNRATTAPFNPNNATPEEYTLLMQAVWNELRMDPNEFPELRLVGGSTAPFDGGITAPDYFRRVLAAGGANYADIFAVHPYTYTGGASGEDRNLVGQLSHLDSIMRSYNNGESIPIWVTEMGWPTHLHANGVSEEVSASFMVRSFTQMISLDFMGRLIWYNFMNNGNNRYYHEHNFGTIRYWNDPVLPWGAKASFVAYNVMSTLLYRAEFVEHSISSTEHLYRFRRADGKDIIVAWDTAAERSIYIPVGNGEFKVYDMYGDETIVQVSGGSINVTISPFPIYIIGDMSGALVSDMYLLSFKPAYEDGEWFIEVSIENASDDLMSGTVRITTPAVFQSDAVAFDSIPANSVAKIRIPISNPGLELYHITVRADIAGIDSVIITENRATSFLRAERASGPMEITGVLSPDKWSGAQEIVLNQASQTRSGASSTEQMQNWGGADDLSAKIYLKWDDDNLYLGVKVKDDVHHQPYTGGNTWMGDSVQFTFDQGRAAGINSQGFSHIVMALTNDGVIENWRVESAHGGANAAIPDDLIETVIVRCDITNTTVYEAAISWELLGGIGMVAETGSLFGFSLLINDNDGAGRRGWIQYMDGIGFGGRNPNLFGDLILVGAVVPVLTVSKYPANMTHNGQFGIIAGNTVITPGSHDVPRGSSVILQAGTVENFTFLGWFRYEDAPISGDTVDPNEADPIRQFNMASGSIHYVAVWGDRYGVVGQPNEVTEFVYVVFHFDGQEVRVPITVEQVLPADQVPTPIPRLGSRRRPGQHFMGWYEEIFPLMHYVNNPERATAFNISQPITEYMLDINRELHLYGSWLQYGDVNGDGDLDMLDILFMQLRILQAITANQIIIATADIHGTGGPTPADLSIVQRHVMGDNVVLCPVYQRALRGEQ